MMNQKHKGCHAELVAVNYLLEQGYEVFRNVSAHGPADIIAWNPETGEVKKIDVKTPTVYTMNDGTIRYAFDKKRASPLVSILFVLDGKVISFADDWPTP